MNTPAYYCSDPILNATLTAYIGQAENAGITIEHHLAIPETLPVDSSELSICFANALENAIKACENLPKNERKIIIRCIHKPAFMFEIENPYKGIITFGKNGLPVSTRIGHGFGTPVVYYDERFTSVLAHKAMLDGGLRKKARQNKALVDEISATIILQSYLESKR